MEGRGRGRAEATPFFERPSPAMTADGLVAPKRQIREALQADLGRPVLFAKIICFVSRLKQLYRFAPSRALTGGALRDRHERWARDAVDAIVSETNARGADGEVAWS